MSKMSAYKIAVTGTIGSGKSTVTKLLAKRYPTISSDDIVHNLYNDSYYATLINQQLFNVDKDKVDVEYIKQRLFNDISFKEKLESVIHPLVIEQIQRFFNEHNSIVIVEVPLLFEAHMENMFDVVLLVKTDESILKSRLINQRGFAEADIDSRLSHQMSVSEKTKRSDYIITNDGSLQQLEAQVNEFIKQIERVI